MPVDTTRVVSSRRTQKKLTEEELQDIDRKRLRGELSCAECRRLKLRCDKKLPCSSCFRRGCESICPLGILAAGQGTRFILADTEQLHDKIYEMSNRIRQLEDALAILQSTVSDQRHPLLTDDLLKIKFGSEAINSRQESMSEDDSATNKSIDALGTLTLGSSGEVQYFGRSAGSETLMMKAGEEAENSSDEDQEGMQLPVEMLLEIDKLANLFPFSSKSRPNVHGLELVEAFLPPHERATQLCRSYIDHGSYFFRPIKPEELIEELFPRIYSGVAVRRQAKANDDHEGVFSVDGGTPHALATLYFIFALGALLDLTKPPYNAEADRYYDLGRAALSLRAVYDSPNIESVQAMGLMATYHSLAGRKYSRDSAWCVMSFAAKIAQSIGLHRDSARWNMDPKTVQKRRNLFWEVFSADMSHSLALGRPPAIHLSYVDCEFPQDEDASLSDDAEHQSGFWRMKHAFAKDIYNSVSETTLVARSPSYNTILDLDKKVREISFPASFNPYVNKDVGLEIFHSSSLCLRDFYASQHRTVTMIYLHRSFFAQAMLDHPANPLLSPFAPSFLTAYRSASVIIKATAHLFERCAAMAMRIWFLMYHTFSAAVIVGTVVTRSPGSNIASIAMRDFNLALGLFERTAAQSQRAKVALGVLLKLREKANGAYEQFSTGGLSPTESSPSQSGLADDIEDDLAIFGGQMRVVDRKAKQSHQRSPSSSASILSVAGFPGGSPKSVPSPSMSPTSESALFDLGLGLPDVHPSLIQYLNQDAMRRVLARDGASAGEKEMDMQPSAPLRHGQYPAQPAGYGYSGAAEGGSQLPAYLSGPVELQLGSGDPSQATPPAYGQTQFISFADPSRTWSTSEPFAESQDYRQGSQPSRRAPENASFGANIEQERHSDVGGRPTPAGYQQQHYDHLGQYSGFRYGAFQPTSYVNPQHGQGTGVPVEIASSSSVENTAGSGMDRAGAIDIGLSSESGVDAGWVSFMRDCGIMDTEG